MPEAAIVRRQPRQPAAGLNDPEAFIEQSNLVNDVGENHVQVNLPERGAAKRQELRSADHGIVPNCCQQWNAVEWDRLIRAPALHCCSKAGFGCDMQAERGARVTLHTVHSVTGSPVSSSPR